MQLGRPALFSRLWSVISVALTVIGFLLFILGSRQAISQTNDKQYLEGRQRERQLAASALVNNRSSGNRGQSVFRSTVLVVATHPPDSGGTNPENYPKNNTSDAKPDDNKSHDSSPFNKRLVESSGLGNSQSSLVKESGPNSQQGAAN